MRELEFRTWLSKENYAPKVQSDVISRIKRIERIYHHTDLDDAFQADKGVTLLSIFANKGENTAMRNLDSSSLPIGKYHLSAYKYAVSLYFKFLESRF